MTEIYTSTTVTPVLAARLRAMPKIELHVHLEGATDPTTVWEMAHRNGVTLPATTLAEWQSLYAFRDFPHFIDIYLLAASCMQTPADYAFMVERFLAQQAAQHIVYSEAFLSASLMLGKGSDDELIEALAAGAASGEAKYGSRVRFIPDIARQLPETRQRVLEFTLRGHARGLFLGLGLGGIEDGFPPELFIDVYEAARAAGLHVVAHAGETTGPATIWGSLHALRAERIGHGVRAVDDPALVAHLAATQIPLEISPYSNYRLGVTRGDQPHQIRALVDAGCCVTLASDDPPMFSTDLNAEYQLLAAQGFSWDEIWRINCTAVEVAFLPDDERAALRAEFAAFVAAIP